MGVSVALGDREVLTVALPVAVLVRVAETDALRLCDADTLALELAVAVMLPLAVALRVGVTLGEADADGARKG